MNAHNGRYILDGKTPVPCEDLMSWATQFENMDRHVAHDEFYGIRISTVFLGIDHSWAQGEDGSIPVLFETMIFGMAGDEYQVRYSTWEQAEEGHKAAVELVLRYISENELDG